MSSSNLPRSRASHALQPCDHVDLYLVLLRVGFSLPRLLPGRAVRSYRTISPLLISSEEETSGIFSVALSIGSRLPGVTWHSTLRSPDFPPLTYARSDCLTDFARMITESCRRVECCSEAPQYSYRCFIACLVR